MDSHHDASSPWNIPTRRFSVRSDRERDATEYARALSSDVTPYAASIISSSDSNSYYRSSRGSRSSIASSLLCPLLDFHDSSRRQSDAGAILPMLPLPVIHPSPDPLPCSNHFDTDCNGWTPDSFFTNKQNNNPTTLSSFVMSSSASTSGVNLFVPLRRRFLPNVDRTSSTTKPRVETQLFGELLLALEEYVAAFGRRVKVSAPHQFSLGDSAAAVVVAAAAGPSNDHSLPDAILCPLVQDSSNGSQVLQNQDAPSMDPGRDPTSLKADISSLEPPGESTSERRQSNEQLDQTSQATHPNSQSQCKVDRTLLSELCEELEYVTSEVIDVVPAFGEKLMQGHYGPLAVRGRGAIAHKSSYITGSLEIANQIQKTDGKPRPSTALERFVDYEPGGSQDTSDGGYGWWAERLLRDLLEGILAETVVKSGSTSVLLSTNSNLASPESVNLGRFSSQNSNEQPCNHDKTTTGGRKTTSASLGGKSKNWLRIPQSTSLVRSGSFINVKPPHNRTLGFSLIDEDEETSSPESKRKTDRISKNPFNTRSDVNHLMVDGSHHPNSTRQLIAEAYQDSIFEFPVLPSLYNDHDPQNNQNQFNPSHLLPVSGKTYNLSELERELRSVDHPQESNCSGNTENQEERTEMNDEHRQKLLDEGRKRWLAFKANQLEPTNNFSHPPSHSDHRHTINNPLSFLNNSNSNREGFTNQFRDPNGRNRANSNTSLRNQSHHRYLYNYLAHHRS